MQMREMALKRWTSEEYKTVGVKSYSVVFGREEEKRERERIIVRKKHE